MAVAVGVGVAVTVAVGVLVAVAVAVGVGIAVGSWRGWMLRPRFCGVWSLGPAVGAGVSLGGIGVSVGAAMTTISYTAVHGRGPLS